MSRDSRLFGRRIARKERAKKKVSALWHKEVDRVAVAILVSDVHLSVLPPPARSLEPDWYEAMRRPLQQIQDLKDDLDVPVVYTGDIFDHWKAPPKLVNFALAHLPSGLAIPGQHDLSWHNYDDMDETAYGTLVRAKHLQDLRPGKGAAIYQPQFKRNLTLWGFPWKCPISVDLKDVNPDDLNLAVIHAYCWKRSHNYPGAPEGHHVKRFRKVLERCGFAAAAFGDNHKGFIDTNGLHIFNGGTLMRRRTDEHRYSPMVGILHMNGEIQPHHIQTEGENFVRSEKQDRDTSILDAMAVVAEIQRAGKDILDFGTAVREAIRDVPPDVRRFILKLFD